MLFVLGVGSLIALKGCAFTVILDAFPHLKTWQVSLFTAVLGFLVGLVYITPVSMPAIFTNFISLYRVLWKST
jgi:solute carrier family 6 amino acid transporter-like protein 5/7/9/14